MENRIFIVSNGGLADMGGAAGHLSGGLMIGKGNYEAIHYGIDFGGVFETIKLNGEIGAVDSRDLLFVPISEACAARCENILSNLHELNERGRWPFEFWGFGPDINPVFKPYGNPKPGHKPRKKAEAHCITFFNWFARSAGIDLSILSKQWLLTNSPKLITDICDDLYDDHKSDNTRFFDQPFSYAIQNLDLGDGYNLPMVRHTGEGFQKAFDLVALFCHQSGGYQAVCDHINTLEPFDCEPEPLDPYLESEFADLNAQPA